MRRMGGSILFVLVVLALAPAAAQASRYCGSVTFEPNTDYTDNNIRATGVSCRKRSTSRCASPSKAHACGRSASSAPGTSPTRDSRTRTSAARTAAAS